MTVGKQNDAFTTPFQPKDYNLKQWRFLFSKEYLEEHKISFCEDSDTTVSEEAVQEEKPIQSEAV